MGDDKKELTIRIHPGVMEDIADDPAAMEAVRNFTATMRQAFDAVQRGQYPTIDEALRAVGVEPVKIDSETGEEIEGASMQEDLERAGIIERSDDD
jgi:hypothetical protein